MKSASCLLAGRIEDGAIERHLRRLSTPRLDVSRVERFKCGRKNVRFGSMLLKKLLMRSVEPSDQLLRAFFVPLFVLLSGRTGEFSAGVQRSLHVGRY
jgi:hypothetical protein